MPVKNVAIASAGTKAAPGNRNIPKSPTGIHGLDDVTEGGLPRGRTTLVCGSAGCGKTILAMEYLLHGAQDYDEPGLFISFEESDNELKQNFGALGFDVDRLIARKKLLIDFVRIDKDEFEETGEFDLEGLFIRLDFAIKTIGAKRVVLDTAETLFGGIPNPAVVRAELVRLFRWLKDRGVTTIITGERGSGGDLTRNGLEEYVSDCVILLDHRVIEQISTRRLRVVKYRGTSHGTNEYPFVIDRKGVSVLPVTALGLEHGASTERIASGIPRLDSMLGGGPYRGSSVLISGTAGTGKSTLLAHFADACCRRGERCMYFAFEESPDQICRNMQTVGLNLRRHIKAGLLSIKSVRPTLTGLEQHLVAMHRMVEEFDPALVVVDPMSNLIGSGSVNQAMAMLLRLVDFLKNRGTTSVYSSLTHGGEALEATGMAISSLMDTWILLRDIELGGERNRGLYVLKCRGTHHSNQIREFRISARGVSLIDVYTGPEGVLTGSARVAQEAMAAAQKKKSREEAARRKRELDRKRKAMEAQIAVMRAQFEIEAQEEDVLAAEDTQRDEQQKFNTLAMARSRSADADSIREPNNGGKKAGKV